jgi:hypothetical protein
MRAQRRCSVGMQRGRAKGMHALALGSVCDETKNCAVRVLVAPPGSPGCAAAAGCGTAAGGCMPLGPGRPCGMLAKWMATLAVAIGCLPGAGGAMNASADELPSRTLSSRSERTVPVVLASSSSSAAARDASWMAARDSALPMRDSAAKRLPKRARREPSSVCTRHARSNSDSSWVHWPGAQTLTCAHEHERREQHIAHGAGGRARLKSGPMFSGAERRGVSVCVRARTDFSGR